VGREGNIWPSESVSNSRLEKNCKRNVIRQKKINVYAMGREYSMCYGEYEKCTLSYRKEKKKKAGNSRHMWEVNINNNLNIFWDMRWSHLAQLKVNCGEGGWGGFCKHGAVPSDNFLTS
jgi:hypothetical protein